MKSIKAGLILLAGTLVLSACSNRDNAANTGGVDSVNTGNMPDTGGPANMNTGGATDTMSNDMNGGRGTMPASDSGSMNNNSPAPRNP